MTIATAIAAGAPTYAADELASAETALKRYDEFVSQRDYKQALSAALDARDRGLEAASVSKAKQVALRAEAERLLTSLESALAVAETQLKAPGPRALAKTAEALRLTRKATVQAVQEARAQLSAGTLTPAIARVIAATAALKRDSSALEDAARKLKK